MTVFCTYKYRSFCGKYKSKKLENSTRDADLEKQSNLRPSSQHLWNVNVQNYNSENSDAFLFSSLCHMWQIYDLQARQTYMYIYERHLPIIWRGTCVKTLPKWLHSLHILWPSNAFICKRFIQVHWITWLHAMFQHRFQLLDDSCQCNKYVFVILI